METLRNGIEAASRFAKKYGPYVMVEALLPGGTLIAAALYAYRNRAGLLASCKAKA